MCPVHDASDKWSNKELTEATHKRANVAEPNAETPRLERRGSTNDVKIALPWNRIVFDALLTSRSNESQTKLLSAKLEVDVPRPRKEELQTLWLASFLPCLERMKTAGIADVCRLFTPEAKAALVEMRQ